MAENSTDVFKRIQEKITQFSWWQGRSEPPNLKEEVDKLIDKTITLSHQEYQRVEGDKDALKKVVGENIRKDGTYQGIGATIRSYESRHAAHQDQHHELKKIENAQGRRALLWRTVSTIAFASVIFFFYWLAGCLGVQLPLSRFGM